MSLTSFPFRWVGAICISGYLVLMADRFHTFLETRRGDLRRISAQTRGEMSTDELASESWLIAIEIGQRRGWVFDFADEDDQDTLFAWMHNRFVKYAEKAIRYAIKLDRDWDNEDGERAGATLARLLTAPLGSDPQAAQHAREEQHELTAIAQHSYSEAAAYVLLLIRVDWHIEDLAALLWIGVSALRERLKKAGLLTRVQPSLFDGVDVVDSDFIPRKRSGPYRRTGQDNAPGPQMAIPF
jgi:hypothetical protein